MTRTPRFVAALAALALFASSANAYIQLVDRDTVNGGDGTLLISGTIVGNDGYAMLSGGGAHRIVKISDIGGANIISTLTTTAAINTALGASPTGISGTLLASGGDLVILENTTDQILSISQATGAATNVLDDATIDALPGVSGSATLSFGDIDPTSGNPVFYEGDTDSIYELTAPNTVSQIVTDTQLASVTGDDTPGGLGVDSSGVLYFGQSSSPENVSFLDLSDNSSGTLITEADVLSLQGFGTDIGISSTAFTVLADDTLVFANTGNPDNFISLDTTNPVAPELVITEDALLSGPASSDAAIAFTSFEGNIAWVQLVNGGSAGAVSGFYAIPEPASAMLLGLASLGLAAFRRR